MVTSSPAAKEGTAPLESWRRLDWRFLLPAPPRGRVLLLGATESIGGDLLSLLPDVTAVVDRPGSGGHDLVVAGSDVDTRTAARLVAPGGALILLRRGAPLPGWVQRERAQLALQGLSSRAHWFVPGLARPSYVAPLDGPQALHQLRTRHHGVPLGRIKVAAIGGLLHLGLLDVIVRDAALVARRHATPPAPMATRWAAESGLDVPQEALHVTPWFAASRHVVALLGSPPAAALKFPRRPGDTSGIDREAERLDMLADLSAFAGRVPELLAHVDLDGQPLLAETAVAGQPLHHAAVRRQPGSAAHAAERLLGRFPVLASTAGRSHWYDDMLGRPLRQFAAAGVLGEDGAALARATEPLVAQLANAQLPLILQHGDLSHPNLLLQLDGELAVLDWERSELQGLPGHDAIFLGQYIAEATAGAWDPQERRRVLDDAFLAPSGSGRAAVLRTLARHSVDPGLYTALLVACWARTSLDLLARLRGSAAVESGAVRVVLSEDRDFMLWRHVVQRLTA